MTDKYRRKLDRVGKGGVHCECCNKYRGKSRQVLKRWVRRVLKQELYRKEFYDNTRS